MLPGDEITVVDFFVMYDFVGGALEIGSDMSL